MALASSSAFSVVSTHSRLKAAGSENMTVVTIPIVSTHSRLKAAGQAVDALLDFGGCFNTQPPKGGWVGGYDGRRPSESFNTQPPKGGW